LRAVSPPPFIDSETIEKLLAPRQAIDALEAALRDGLDPEADPPRVAVGADAGQLLLMPSSAGHAVGVKVVSVAPGNADRGLPRIQGVYVLLDPATLTPVALLDGIALTNLRTAAVSALAVRHLARPGGRRLLLFGTGPQAWAHVQALRAVAPVEHVDVAARDRARLQAFARRCADSGLGVRTMTAGPEIAEAVAAADLVCCCTTAREPLFDGSIVRGHATVVAIGSHEPDAREVDERLVARSTVVVEARSAALREAGDVIAALAAGACDAASLITLDALVRGESRPAPDGPRLFKGTGMAWEDAVVAAAVQARAVAAAA
jgi:ornithine cyclodeaminase